MSEEIAASIGDVLAENERLRQQLAQAEAHAARYWIALRRLAAAWRAEQGRATAHYYAADILTALVWRFADRATEQDEQIAQLAALAVENEG